MKLVGMNSQGHILTVDFGCEAPKFLLESCCGFLDGFFLLFFQRKFLPAPKNPPKNPSQNPQGNLFGKNSMPNMTERRVCRTMEMNGGILLSETLSDTAGQAHRVTKERSASLKGHSEPRSGPAQV